MVHFYRKGERKKDPVFSGPNLPIAITNCGVGFVIVAQVVALTIQQNYSGNSYN
jgi:hypothetical protein